MSSRPPHRARVEVNLRDLRQLFDSMDPSPFRERDLAPAAENYIVDSIKELPARAACALVLHVDQPKAGPDEETDVGGAVRAHFVRRAALLRRDLRVLLRRGFVSLAIGVAFLVTLFAIAQLARRLIGDGAVARIVEESLLIAGWVAMWRPLEIFLYDWWPILGELRLRERLSEITVELVYRS
jgi:hypothetical protein